MNANCCCRETPPAPSETRRWPQLLASALSIGVWVVMPKCPLCVAAHLTLWTGLGISYAGAAYLRGGLLLVSAAILMGLVVKSCWPKLTCGARPGRP